MNTIHQTQTAFGLFRKIEMHLYLSNTTLDFKSLPNANSAQKHIFVRSNIFGGHSPR